MPEGDTLYKVAHYMAPQLVGHELRDVQLLGATEPTLVRRRVLCVNAQGKHLIVRLTPEGPDGMLIRVHLGMHGTWHSYPPRAPLKWPKWDAHVILERADGHRFICFRAEDVETLTYDQALHDAVLSRLGPDLLAAQPDFERIMARVARTPEDGLMIDLLLNQRVAAGLGNVYKNELMFLHELRPDVVRSALPACLIERVYRDGAILLRRNLGGWPRTITYDRTREPERFNVPRYFVYGRKGEPCLRCHATILRCVAGRHRRSVYFCPECQKVGGKKVLSSLRQTSKVP